MARTTPRRTGYKKSEISREQVLDAAIDVLAKRGIAATSVQDIADGAGLSKGAVHYHFESKDELLREVLDRCCKANEERIRTMFAKPGSPLERVHWAMEEMWRVRRDGVREMRVITDLHMLARQNDAIRLACGDALRRARLQMVEVGLTELVALGLKPRVPVEVIPRLLMATLDGLALHQEIDPIPESSEAAVLEALEATAISFFEVPDGYH